MSDTTTTPTAAFNPMNRFVTFDGLKDYDANLISNLHSLGYNNKVSGANVFAWGNNNRIDGQNLFVFGNGFNLTTNQRYPSLFLGNGYALGEWEGAENTIFGVWGPPGEGVGKPIFRVGAESEDQITAAFSIRNNGSFSAASGAFTVNENGVWSTGGKISNSKNWQVETSIGNNTGYFKTWNLGFQSRTGYNGAAIDQSVAAFSCGVVDAEGSYKNKFSINHLGRMTYSGTTGYYYDQTSFKVGQMTYSNNILYFDTNKTYEINNSGQAVFYSVQATDAIGTKELYIDSKRMQLKTIGDTTYLVVASSS